MSRQPRNGGREPRTSQEPRRAEHDHAASHSRDPRRPKPAPVRPRATPSPLPTSVRTPRRYATAPGIQSAILAQDSALPGAPHNEFEASEEGAQTMVDLPVAELMRDLHQPSAPVSREVHITAEPEAETETDTDMALATPTPRRAHDLTGLVHSPRQSDPPSLARTILEPLSGAAPSYDPRLILLREPDSVRAAGLRVLRDSLLAQGAPRVMAVTSPHRAEGKTTLAINLALALVELPDMSVLVVEAHHPAPQIAALFDLVPPTESDYLEGSLRVPPYDIVEILPGLDVACVHPRGSGQVPPFDLRSFAAAIDTFSEFPYDFILVDAPPVLGTAVVNRIAEKCDSLLLTVRAGQSRISALRRATDQLGRQRILGVTLIDA